MEAQEFLEIFNHMTDDVAAIIHNQTLLAGIHSELDRRLLNPVEQDFIYAAHSGHMPAEPRVIEHHGVKIKLRVMHQTGKGLRDVKGADLLYEIEGNKFVLVQYKKEYVERIKADSKQLKVFLDNCPDVCRYKKKRVIPKDWLPVKINSFCGAWYCVILDNEKKYVHACEAEAIFGANSSIHSREFNLGLTDNTFMELFSSCRIGALVKNSMQRNDLEKYQYQLLENGHIIYEIRQSGRW